MSFHLSAGQCALTYCSGFKRNSFRNRNVHSVVPVIKIPNEQIWELQNIHFCRYYQGVRKIEFINKSWFDEKVISVLSLDDIKSI